MSHNLDSADWSDTIAAFAPLPPGPMSMARSEPQAAATDPWAAPDPSSAEWAVRCSRRIQELDARIEAAQAARLALFMSSRATWRLHSPHEAAERLYRLTSIDQASAA